MKTFEEALSKHYRKSLVADVDEEIIENAAKEISDALSGYECLAEEARNSEAFNDIKTFWFKLAIVEGLETAIFAAFMTGLVTGVEMEKISPELEPDEPEQAV
jgi:hypothetical protein